MPAHELGAVEASRFGWVFRRLGQERGWRASRPLTLARAMTNFTFSNRQRMPMCDREHHDKRISVVLEYDYVVVGAGSAGCVIASRLTEAGFSVLLTEAGRGDFSPFVLIPAGLLKIPPSSYWYYELEPDVTRHGRREPWVAGKLVGGGSSVNAMLWVRGNRLDFDAWSEAGADGWDYESILPVTRELESYADGDPAFRGRRGPQPVSQVGMTHRMAQRYIEGAQAIGIPWNADYNGDDQWGVGWAQVSQKRGIRYNAGRSFLKPVKGRSNLDLWTRTRVSKVLFSGTRAVGVSGTRRGKPFEVRARREVVVSAGAIESPALLMRSGVGDGRHLEAVGIEVVLDAPAVGKNLQDHPTAGLTFEVRERTLNQELTPGRIARHAWDYVAHGTGPGASSLTHAIIFESLNPETRLPTYQAMFAPLATEGNPHAAEEEGANSAHDKQGVKLSDHAAVTVYVSLLHPSGRGSIRLNPVDPEGAPVIEYPYLASDSDVRSLQQACERVREVFQSDPVRPFVVQEGPATREIRSDAQWDNFLRGTSFSASHWCGTARIGTPGDPATVVDPALKIVGLQGIRVADASVFPTIPSGNTNAPSILVGGMGARLILSDADRGAS